jgi:hypothetical protein
MGVWWVKGENLEGDCGNALKVHFTHCFNISFV